MTESQCVMHVLIDGEGVLCCTLPAGHDGLHFDEYDRVYWQTEVEREAGL